jgi:hypothetical protein
MRASPISAEPVQDAAIVCKHCGRHIPAARAAEEGAPRAEPSASPASGGKLRVSVKRVAALTLIMVAALIFLVRVVRTGGGSDAGGVASSLAGAAGVLPDVVTKIPDDSIQIGPGELHTWSWAAEPPRTSCRLTGQLEVVAGGSKDVQVFVASDSASEALMRGDNTSAFFSTEKVSSVDLNVETRGPGRYRLVVSNAFSMLTSKTIRIRGAKVTCSV